MTAPYPTKLQLSLRGQRQIQQWCELNGIDCPPVKRWAKVDWPFDACAYYRPTIINICDPKCASIGTTGQAWSYPGHAIDRTPYHYFGSSTPACAGRASTDNTDIGSARSDECAREWLGGRRGASA
ncbi:hypothetical protein GAY33_26635, partial [Azospirillum brasilense]|uniref:hypothetical protein n=1 Tax=Azospirillum argentinense TaxID=2970906 RepID=UPI00190E8AE5